MDLLLHAFINSYIILQINTVAFGEGKINLIK